MQFKVIIVREDGRALTVTLPATSMANLLVTLQAQYAVNDAKDLHITQIS